MVECKKEQQPLDVIAAKAPMESGIIVDVEEIQTIVQSMIQNE